MYQPGDTVYFKIAGKLKCGVVEWIDHTDHRVTHDELLNIYVKRENTVYKEIPRDWVVPVVSVGEKKKAHRATT